MTPVSLAFADFRMTANPTLARSLSETRVHFSWPGLIAAILLVIVSLARHGVAQITVTTTQQGITDPSNCSLQEAIYGAEFGTNKAVSQYFNGQELTYKTGCSDPSGNWNTIVLQNVTYGFSTFWDGDTNNPFGPTATPIIFKTITIQGNGATLQWTGTGYSRLFAVGQVSINNLDDGTSYSGTGNLTLQDVYIKNFKVHGGNGSCGGGGGLGAGGAIYVGKVSSNAPALTVINSTFVGNSAAGGVGSGSFDTGCVPYSGTNQAGGGGGGLSGNGGNWSVPNGGGGGGGGARGNGGLGDFGGGGGGGTVFDGGNDDPNNVGGAGGVYCGAQGAGPQSGGHDATCAGGGGGGGGQLGSSNPLSDGGGSGGNGLYGGGGGGGGKDNDNAGGSGSGGNAGFGGGGGASGTVQALTGSTSGGNGGFGGGGGAGFGTITSGGSPGSGGTLGGNAVKNAGGGGAALGGAIFNDSGTITVQNSTFNQNSVTPGAGGGSANGGADGGAAVFSRNGSLTIQNATISGNRSNSNGGGITVISDSSTAALTLDNTILGNNGGNFECETINSVSTKGAGNLIMSNGGCPGVAVTSDPQLSPINLNTPGDTPTMAIQYGTSPAVDAGDDSTALTTDQRGVTRPQGPHSDIGAYEAPAPTADLSIVKTVASATAQPGDPLTYTLAVANAGPNTANSVTVTDVLPTQVTFVSCTESTGTGTCTFSGGTVSVTYATLANGASSTVTIHSTLNSGVIDGLNVGNSASVSASSPTDPNTNNNSSTAYFTIHNRADLAVTKTVSTTSPYAPQVEVGDSLTYTVSVTNKGPYDARGVMLSDSAPSGVTFTACTSTVGTCVWSASGASLSFSALTNGSTATVTIQATLNFGVADGSTITNTASVTSTTFDPDTSNNAASASFTALNNSDLAVSQSATKLTSRQLRYTVNVKNLGKYLAKQLLLTDAVPNGTYLVSIAPGAWSCSAPPIGSTGTISCTLPTEAVSITQTLTFVVKVKTPGSVLVNNTANVSAATFDPNTANNTSTLSSKVGP